MLTGELYNFAKDSTTNSLKYSGPGGLFHIGATFNFETTSQNICGFYVGHSTDDSVALDPDGDRISESEVYVNGSTTANQPVGGAIQSVLDLATDDRVFFIVQNKTAANNITVEFLKFTVTALTAEKGDTGATGPVGATGAIGVSGATGSIGPSGATGPVGVTGATGVIGVSGATGPAGVAGATGATGAVGVSGATGVVGVTGATGAQGATGVAGVTGATGATGVVGVSGATGATGVVGVSGATGATGATGVGAAGATGATGAVGVSGAAGVAGSDGATGATGVIGATGVVGVSGATGAQGATGAAGAGGASGATGATGVIGVSGATGAVGVSGATGATGVGATGATGPAGTVTIGTSAADVLSAAAGEITADDAAADNIVFWDDSAGKLTYLALGDGVAIDGTTIYAQDWFVIAASDESTNLATGTNKVYFRMPYAGTLLAVRASVNTAPTGSTLIVDINEAGTSLLSTKLSIDASEKTSTTAATAAVISDSALADDAEITIDIDQVGSTIAGKGLKVYLKVRRG
jgi:hypothetical protein